MNAKWMEAILAPHMSITIPEKSRRLPRLAMGGLWFQTIWQPAEQAKQIATPIKYRRKTTASIGWTFWTFWYNLSSKVASTCLQDGWKQEAKYGRSVRWLHMRTSMIKISHEAPSIAQRSITTSHSILKGRFSSSKHSESRSLPR